MQDSIRIIFTFVFTVISYCLFSQVIGVVSDASGDPVPFVTVYIQGTSTGTVSNLEGEYSLNVEDGAHVLIYKFIGYAEHLESVNYQGEVLELDVILKEESIKIEEVVVTADGEDPAYRVIRNAIKVRDSYKDEIEKYEVDLYVKGVVKMLKAPTKVLGQEIGDMEGMLDSTGQGIVYLAESQSKLSFHQPDLLKEEMYSSIVAEDDGSYNFNRFLGSNFDIYSEYFEFNRSILNPLADNALLFYKYKMLETKFDDEGRLINRIQVIPKSSARPTMFGELHIVEDKWNVKELDLSFTGKAIKEPVFDTINIRQVLLPVLDDQWRVVTQIMSFRLGLFGFKIGGGFTYVFSDYNLNPIFDKSYFGTEEFKMDAAAIKTDSVFWTKVRPVKLTEEERLNYIKKDSLKRLWNSKSYMDSLDRKNNKFGLTDLLFGYSHNNTYSKRYLTYSSPISTYKFNPITGHSLNFGLNYLKIDSSENRRFNMNTKIGYGFADKRFRFESLVNLRTNRMFWENFAFGVGDNYKQINERNPVFTALDTWTSLFEKDNQARFFRKQYVTFKYQREVSNGIFLTSDLTYAHRSNLTNNTEYSFRKKEELYKENIPELIGLNPFFENHNDLKFRVSMRFRIGQKYSSFPKFRIRNPSNWPDIWLRYEKGIALADTDYDKVTLRIAKDRINYKLYGYSSINLIASSFLTKKKVEVMDLHHFLSNENLVSIRSRYMNSFKMMPHYRYSTTNNYMLGFYEHNLDGYVLDLIPLVNKLGWTSVVSANALIREDQSNYYEVAVGISDIKIGAFSLFRLDYVWSYDHTGLLDRGFVIGLSGLFE